VQAGGEHGGIKNGPHRVSADHVSRSGQEVIVVKGEQTRPAASGGEKGRVSWRVSNDQRGELGHVIRKVTHFLEGGVKRSQRATGKVLWRVRGWF